MDKRNLTHGKNAIRYKRILATFIIYPCHILSTSMSFLSAREEILRANGWAGQAQIVWRRQTVRELSFWRFFRKLLANISTAFFQK